MIYLDHAATTPVPREVADAMYQVLTEGFGNPSAQYAIGREMAERVAAWRKTVADALDCPAEALCFTSCGTEGDNWAIQAALWQNRRLGKHIVTTSVEHSAILQPCQWLAQQGYEVTYVAPDGKGNIPAERILAAVRPDTALVSVMLVNNELGTVYPIQEIAQGLKTKNPRTLLHTDAVQGFLKVPFQAKTLGADLISISSHKIHGPKGCGALYIRKGLTLPPYLHGGGQEQNYRSGTEGIPAIAGFGAACRAANPAAEIARMKQVRDYGREVLKTVPGLVLTGAQTAPHIISLALPGLRSQGIINCLQDKEIYVSAGSACAKGHRSHVLEAMGLPAPVIDGSIRVSLSAETTEADMDALRDALLYAKETLKG